jgi:hypothetical protein
VVFGRQHNDTDQLVLFDSFYIFRSTIGIIFRQSHQILSLYGSTTLCWTLAAFLVSLSFIQSVGLLGRRISPPQGRYLHTDIHASSGIRTHDPSVWAGEESLCLRPCDRCDRFSSDVPCYWIVLIRKILAILWQLHVLYDCDEKLIYGSTLAQFNNKRRVWWDCLKMVQNVDRNM